MNTVVTTSKETVMDKRPLTIIMGKERLNFLVPDDGAEHDVSIDPNNNRHVTVDGEPVEVFVSQEPA